MTTTTWIRIRGALIRFGYTFIAAFVAQPVIATILDKPAKITAQELYAAALAALVYAAKKYLFPDTIL